MPILASAPKPAEPTPDEVRRVMAFQQEHCAPSTWDRFVSSLVVRKFPIPS